MATRNRWLDVARRLKEHEQTAKDPWEGIRPRFKYGPYGDAYEWNPATQCWSTRREDLDPTPEEREHGEAFSSFCFPRGGEPLPPEVVKVLAVLSPEDFRQALSVYWPEGGDRDEGLAMFLADREYLLSLSPEEFEALIAEAEAREAERASARLTTQRDTL